MVEPAKKKIPYKIMILGVILSTGVILHLLGWFDVRRFLAEAEAYARAWWFAPAIVVAKVALYAFALPGSMLIWVAGLFYAPLTATMVIVAGGTGGAVAAYAFTRGMSTDFAGGIESSRFFNLLRRHSDLATLCAIRTLPNFPHSVINYGAGILGVPLPRFIAATIVGFSAKGYLYASMIRRAATAEGFSDVVDLRTVGSLFIIAGLFVAGKLIQRYARTTGRG